MQASLTGHLVLATLHTNDAPSAVTRLIDMGIEPFLLSSSLLGVLAQRLVRKLCPHCKIQDGKGQWHPVGCAECGHSGYKGRTGVYELMVADDRVRALIHNRAPSPRSSPRPRLGGMHSMREDGDRLVAEGITSPEEVMRSPESKARARCPRTSSRRSTAPASPPPACSRPTTSRPPAPSCARSRWCRSTCSRSVSAGTQPAGNFMTMRRKVFTSTALAVWTRQLAGLVGSGLPLERALTLLSEEAEDPRQRELVAHLRSEVNSGSPFARALSSAPREFDDVYRAVVAAGEQSGALGRVLERMADDLEERQALRGKLMGATLYPAIVSVIAVVIVIFLVTYVVPQVASVFVNCKRALPFLTSAMLAVSAFLRGYGWLLALALVGGVLAAAAALRNEVFREQFDAGLAEPAAVRARWPAATTPPVSPAPSRCWPAPACPS